MSFKTSCYFQDKPQTPCLGTRPLWSGSFLHLQPPLLMGLHPLMDTPASFSHSHLPRSASPGPWHLLCFALLCCLVIPSSRVTLLPKLDFLGEAFAYLTSQTRLLRTVSHSPASCPTLPAGTTMDSAGFVNGGLSWVLASHVWLCPLQYSRGLVQCLSQSGRSVKFGERVKKHVVFVKVIPGCWGGGSLQHHRPGIYDRKTMSWAPHTVCIMCPLYRW